MPRASKFDAFTNPYAICLSTPRLLLLPSSRPFDHRLERWKLKSGVPGAQIELGAEERHLRRAQSSTAVACSLSPWVTARSGGRGHPGDGWFGVVDVPRGRDGNAGPDHCHAGNPGEVNLAGGSASARCAKGRAAKRGGDPTRCGRKSVTTRT